MDILSKARLCKHLNIDMRVIESIEEKRDEIHYKERIKHIRRPIAVLAEEISNELEYKDTSLESKWSEEELEILNSLSLTVEDIVYR